MEKGARFRLGDFLVAKKLITPEQLERALHLQRACGSRLGGVLLGEGYIRPQPLHAALAEQAATPFVDLMRQPPERRLLDAADREHYLKLLLVPWRRTESHLLLATAELTADARSWALARYGADIQFFMTSPQDIRWTVEKFFAAEDDEDARLGLARLYPESSARTLLRHPLAFAGMTAGIAAAAAAMAASHWIFFSFVVLVNLFYGATLAFKLIIFLLGAARPPASRDDSYLYLPEARLPHYTLLIPLYKEQRSLPGLLAAIRGLDYPRSRLDVKLVVEADDAVTIEAIKALRPEAIFEMVRVPPSTPRTKPKACNYALRFARGEYLTIYDAEDRPEPAQLRKVVRAFMDLPKDVVCLQARLNYYNHDENWLTRLFALEYSAWFDFMLKGLQKLDIPIPLGGTSNHIALHRLRNLGAWDPYNVTEDADLGIRIAALGGRTAMVDSHTLEEAPTRLTPWLKQRTRWIKGYMQTWAVHMRTPLKLWKALGTVGFAGFQLFVGGPAVVFLLAPVMWGISIAWMAGLAGFSTLSLPPWLVVAALANLLGGIAIHYGMAATALERTPPWRETPAKERRMARAAACFPFYWVLHSLAALRALWQLFTRPHFWDKTDHGLTTMGQDQQLAEQQKLLRFQAE